MTLNRKPTYTFTDLNKDLNDLYVYLKKEKYTEKEIKNLMLPLTSKLTEENKTLLKILHSCLIFFLVLAVIYFFTYWDKFYWNLTALTRIFLIKILNLYDWRYLKNEMCLIDKNLFQNKAIFQQELAFECDLCESVQNLDEIVYNYEDIDSDFIERLLKLDRPILIRGGIEHWTQHSPEDFVNILTSDVDFSTSVPCKLSSNIFSSREDSTEAKSLIFKTSFFESFFLHFQNCEKRAVRVFRNITSRPDIVPDVMSPVTLNWLLWSKNYNVSKFKPIDLVEKYTMIGQIFGGIVLKLIPRKNCKEICAVLEVPLYENEFILFSSLWDVEYKPFGKGENLGAVLEIKG
ncbi:uncharacterized protein LOC115883463 [Sitophilus oryzae]|uniref:Uncharacterized protein LOC115883463 n=1 Tax=Sitophilus oryzae TaxID=7048 RepID=A0A6J2Y3Y3_SITOR|nr:uncharacterized protein LOC115883463 [Sitophilus oryzae]